MDVEAQKSISQRLAFWNDILFKSKKHQGLSDRISPHLYLHLLFSKTQAFYCTWKKWRTLGIFTQVVTRALGGIFSSSLFCFALNKVLFFSTALAFCIYFSTYNYVHRCVSGCKHRRSRHLEDHSRSPGAGITGKLWATWTEPWKLNQVFFS